jgi:hypothetical protein
VKDTEHPSLDLPGETIDRSSFTHEDATVLGRSQREGLSYKGGTQAEVDSIELQVERQEASSVQAIPHSFHGFKPTPIESIDRQVGVL